MRIIDADKLYPDCMTKDGKIAISQSQLANASTVYPNQGEWVYDENFVNHFRCNLCNDHNDDKTNFCPNCGADMRNITETPSSCITTNPNSVEAYYQSLKEGAI